MNELNISPYIMAGLRPDEDLPQKRVPEYIKVTPDDIFKATSDYFKIPVESIKAKGRKTEIVYARKLCIFIIREETLMSLSNIGKLFEGTMTDHTSVRHCIKFAKKQTTGRIVNPQISHDIKMITLLSKGIQTVKYNSINN